MFIIASRRSLRTSALLATALLFGACSSAPVGEEVEDTDTGRGGRDIEPIDADGEVGPDAGPDASPDADAGTDDATDVPETSTDLGDTDAGGSDIPDAEAELPDVPSDTATGLPIGEPCEESAECESRLCVDTTGGEEPGICSSACDTTDDCPATYECYQLTLDGVAVLGVCLPDEYCSDPDGDGYGKGPGCAEEDCDEDSEFVNPGATEICDNIDNNCNDEIDEGIVDLGGACTTGLEGLCGQGTEVCTDGAIECVPSFTATAETCDGLDNNCNGEVDDGLTCDPLPECERVYGAYLCNTPGTFALPIPVGVEDIIAIAWGGGGAGGNQGNGTGGGGGYIFAGGLDAIDGETLRVIVGDGGRSEGGGGGASYVYRGATLLAVAAGGGGGASDGCSGCYGGGAGGAGGGLEGVAGQATILPSGYGPYGYGLGGGGGTQSAGGAAGITAGSTGGSTCLSDGLPGLSNAGGRGGGGGPDCIRGGAGGVSEVAGAAGWGNGSAGGGGAGYLGGGGGGGRDTYFGAGGGGGSSWVHPSLFTATVELVAGVGRVPGDAADHEFYLGTNAVGGVAGRSSDANTNGQPGVVAILMFPPPWF